MRDGGAPTRRAFLRALAAAPLLAACDVREYARQRGAKLRLSIATGPVGGTYYTYGGGVAKIISANVRNVEATAELTSASVDNLTFLRNGQADLAFTIAPALQDAYRGTGTFARIGRVPVAALAVLYVQPTHLVTLASRRVASLADLRGRIVSTGIPGSGTEDIVLQILEAAGMKPDTDIRRQRLGPNQAAEALRDGKIDAFFWSAGVPNNAVLDLTTTLGRRVTLLPTAEVLPALQRRHGSAIFVEVVIPRRTYPGLDVDVPTVGTSSLLVVDEAMGEALAYDITRALFDHQPELAAIRAEARALKPELASTGSPVPFHPGAIRFYHERGAWRG